jgi:Uncharacterised nucleotidyltransferase
VSVTNDSVLLARAALLDGDEALRAWRSWRRTGSLDALDADARTLLPMLYRNLVVLDPQEPELPRLRGVYRHVWLRSQQQFKCAAEALRVLSTAGFETLVLKGAALMVQSYRDEGVRPMVDVDVLVRTERARDASELLLRSGWRRRERTDFAAEMQVTPGTAFGDADGGWIDLHWHSLWAPSAEDDFWEAAVPIELAGVPTLGLCHADHLLQVCVHGVWSGETQPVRWLVDATMVLRSAGAELDWRRVVERARARSLTLPLARAMRSLREWLGTSVPDWVLCELDDSPHRPAERAAHWAWTGPPTRTRRALILADNYLRRRSLPPSEARPPGLAAYADAYAQLAWGVQRRREIPLTAVRRLVRRELFAA